jgi:hypothetical protein
MKLIDEAKQWWKMTSIHAAALWAAVQVSWGLMSDQDKLALVGQFFPADKVSTIIAAIGFLVVVSARLTKQEAVSGK